LNKYKLPGAENGSRFFMAIGTNNLAFKNDNMSFGSNNMAQTFNNMALVGYNLALEQKKACQV